MATCSCRYLMCLCLVLTALQILDLGSTYICTGCLLFHTFGTVHEMQLLVSRIILGQDVSAYDWVALASCAQIHVLKVSVYYPSDLKFVHMILTSATALESLKLGNSLPRLSKISFCSATLIPIFHVSAPMPEI